MLKQNQWREWIVESKPDIQTQLNYWLNLVQKNSSLKHDLHSCEMRDKDIVVLMRDHTNSIDGCCLTIAAVCLPKSLQRKGWFKSFLVTCCKLNPWSMLIIEDVLNPHLQTFLAHIEAKSLSDFYPTTYVVNVENALRLRVEPLSTFDLYVKMLSQDTSN